MAVFRVEKTRNYTIMSNYHLKDRSLSLKSKGLLSIMLSLPDEQNYTMRNIKAYILTALYNASITMISIIGPR